MMTSNTVGPVLMACDMSRQVISALKKLNPVLEIQDQGAYFRILVPNQCRLTVQAVKEESDNSFVLPDSLELIMPSFKGRMHCTSEEVIWYFN